MHIENFFFTTITIKQCYKIEFEHDFAIGEQCDC